MSARARHPWQPAFVPAMHDFAINTSRRIGHFLAQLGPESQGLSCLEENLSYSTQRLTALFGKRIPAD